VRFGKIKKLCLQKPSSLMQKWLKIATTLGPFGKTRDFFCQNLRMMDARKNSRQA